MGTRCPLFFAVTESVFSVIPSWLFLRSTLKVIGPGIRGSLIWRVLYT